MSDPPTSPHHSSQKAPIAFVKTTDRIKGVRQAIELLGIEPFTEQRVFIKPNYNSADPTPGSTHPDVLRALVGWLHESAALSITVGDRSGMGSTRQVMETLGVFTLGEQLGFETIVFDELGADDWVRFQPDGSHWKKGFYLARPCLETDALIQACCLKTHQLGGHFTLSLKNSVGMVAKHVPGDRHNYMYELHLSRNQRLMIAEINAAYSPRLVVLDGIEAFVSRGPANGKLVSPQIILAGVDRIAIDAVGVAILRHFGTTKSVTRGGIFKQAQIARAVELGLGVSSPDQIEFLTADPDSATYARQIQELLLAG